MPILGPNFGYVDLINFDTTETLKAWAEEGGRAHFPLRPSSAGKCTRALANEMAEWLGKAKFPAESRSPESHRLLGLGSSVEYHLLKEIKEHVDLFKVKYGQQVVELFRLTPANLPDVEHVIEGSVDAVFWSEDFKCVIDVKSKKDKWSAGHKSDWDATTDKLRRLASVQAISDAAFWVEDLEAFLVELNDPFFSDNFVQVNCYAHSEFLKSRGVDHGAICQYNKNDSRLREVRFKPSQVVFDRVRRKFQTALDAAYSGGAAPRDYVLGSIKCAFCRFAQDCWGEDSLKAYFATFPKRRWPARIEDLDDVAADFEAFELASAQGEKAEQIEREIVRKLMDQKVDKVRLSNGAIYEVKALKTKGLVLRRSKL